MPMSSIRTKLHKIYKAPVSRYLPYIPKPRLPVQMSPSRDLSAMFNLPSSVLFLPMLGAEEGAALTLDCALWDQGGCCHGASLSILGSALEVILPSFHLISVPFQVGSVSVHKEFSENMLASYAILGGPRHQTRRTSTALSWITASILNFSETVGWIHESPLQKMAAMVVGYRRSSLENGCPDTPLALFTEQAIWID